MVSRLRRAILCVPVALFAAGVAEAVPASMPAVSLPSIDGGDIALSGHAGQPILLVNTASLCAFSPQFEGLQALWERYGDAGLLVVAVPSDDFRQELESDAAVADFCELTWGIDMPMTTILPVLGAEAHPLYLWLQTQGVRPTWNFHKVLIGRDGRVVDDWPSPVAPMSRPIRRAVEAELAR